MKQYSLIGIGIILSLLILPLASASDVFTEETKNNYKLTWEINKDYSNNQEYYLTIKNYENNSRGFDLSVLIDFNVDADINIYEYKDIDTTIYETECVTKNRQSINNITFENELVEYETCDSVEKIVSIAQYKEVAGNKRKLSSSLFKDYGMINIPPKGSKLKTDYYNNKITFDGEKYFKITITNINPILYSGVLGIIDFASGQLYHPQINSTFYTMDCTTDGNNPDICATSNILNSSNPLRELNTLHLSTNIDSNPNSNDVTFFNGAHLTSGGKIGEGMDFDGVDDYGNITNTPTIQFGVYDFTITYWVHLNSTPTIHQSHIQHRDQDAGDSAGWFIRNNNVDFTDLRFQPRGVGGAGDCVGVFDTNLVINTWYYVVIVSDRSGNAEMFVNNVSEGTLDITTCQESWDSEEDMFVASRYAGDSTLHWNNITMDEIAFFNTTLTTAQRSELYASDNPDSGQQYPYDNTDTFLSDVFNTGSNHNVFTPNFICTGNCSVNITVEDESFIINNSVEYTLATPPVDGNTTFNYSIDLGLNSAMEYFNITFATTGVINPSFSNVNFYSLNSSLEVIGNESTFNFTNLQIIEFAMVNFTVNDFQENFSLYYTMNGTNACALGNMQSATCINYPNYVRFLNNTVTTYFDATQGTRGDFINCEFVGSTERNYSCVVDEHYQNVFKWYSADYNFSDVKYQDGLSQRIGNSGTRIIKVELDETNIPLNAEFYKLDYRVQAVNNPSELDTFLCNSSYSTGNPVTSNSCVLIDSKAESELQDDGEKSRTIFGKEIISGLGDIKYVLLQSQQVGINNYYALKTFISQNATWNTHWNYSTNSGGTWTNLGDGYETELNINWYYNDTGFVVRLNSNLTNSTDNVLFWSNVTIPLPPIVSITLPPNDFTTNNTNLTVSWITISQDGTLNVSVYLDGVINQTGFNDSDTTNILNISLGIHTVTVESCDNNLCDNDTHTFTITGIIPVIDLLVNFTCLSYADCIDGVRRCELVVGNNSEVVETTAFDIDCIGFRSENFAFIYLVFAIALIFTVMGVIKRIPVFMLGGSMFGIIGGIIIWDRWLSVAWIIFIFFFAMILLAVGLMFRD